MTGTIGNGTVEVGNADALDDVNRDVEQVRETVSETDGGAFDASVAVDHRVFSQTGRSEMGAELKELPAIPKAAHYARNEINDPGKAERSKPLPAEKAVFHNQNMEHLPPEEQNEKRVSKPAVGVFGYGFLQHESVKIGEEGGNKNKEIDDIATDNGANNMATFNVCNWEPCHSVLDIAPWVVFGSSEQDVSTIWERTQLVGKGGAGLVKSWFRSEESKP